MKKKNTFMAAALTVVIVAGIAASGAIKTGLIGDMVEAKNKVTNLQITDNNVEEQSNLSKVSQTVSTNNDVQELVSNLDQYNYEPLVVQKNVPVRWTIVADSQSLNYCNNEIIIPDLGITKVLSVGENVIEFTPTETGIIQYSCWMGMIGSTIAVVDDLNNYDEAEIQSQLSQSWQGSGSCFMTGYGERGYGGRGCCGGGWYR